MRFMLGQRREQRSATAAPVLPSAPPAAAAGDPSGPQCCSVPRNDQLGSVLAREVRARGRVPKSAALRQALIQRVTKPKTPDGLEGTLSMLEKAVRENDDAAAAIAARHLFASSPTFYANLLRYKLTKHEDGGGRWQGYLDASSDAARLVTLQVACEQRDRRVATLLVDHFFSLTAAQRLALARRSDPAFLVEHVLTPGKERRPGHIVPVLQEHPLMDYLKRHAPAAYAAFASDAPQLRVVENVMGALPPDATARQVVDAIFQAIVTNTSIDVAYLATQLTPVEHILTGDTEPSRNLHAQQSLALPAIPAIPATDCHHLLMTFEAILKSYPRLDVDYERVTLTKAVLTQPLATMPGGLIARTFAGNVFDEAGATTGQIFFTGEDGVNSHSWLKVDGKSYDILFGTTGAAVQGAVAGQFVQTKDPQVYRQVNGGSFLIADPALPVPANPYSFSTAYRLTRHPSRLGKDRKAL